MANQHRAGAGAEHASQRRLLVAAILADAMEDAGFDDIGVLHSARHDPHAGNWIVGLVLNERDASYKWLEEYAQQINEAMPTEEFAGEPVTVGRLLQAARSHFESGGDSIWFGIDHYGEEFTKPDLVALYHRHAEVLLKATIYKDDDWFYPFHCSC